MPPATEPLAIARPPRRRLAISLTPLIDVVFILLIFFMLATNFMEWRAIDLGTPVETGGGSSAEGAMLVDLRADGSLRLAGESLSLEALESRLGARFEQVPEQRVLLRAERGVPLQDSVRVLDRLNALGLAELSLLPPAGG